MNPSWVREPNLTRLLVEVFDLGGGKDVPVNSDDFVLDSVERSQRNLTRRRHSERSRRRQLYALTGLLLALALGLSIPSLVSHSSMGRSILIRKLAENGLTAEVNAIRIGWITPLRVTGLQVKGEAGTQLAIDQLDVDLTVTDLMGSINHFGEVTLRGVALACQLDEGSTSLEQDLAILLTPADENASASASVKVQDLTVTLTDAITGGVWQVTQSSAEVETDVDEISATFAGVLTEPSGGGGSLQGEARFTLASQADASRQGTSWTMGLESESLPLSIMSLVRRRFPEAASSIPYTLSGDATGSISMTGSSDGSTEASINQLQIRNLRASDEGSRVWRNSLATVDGQLILLNNRVIGKQLKASTDFASTTIDGAFSRNFSLVGANDNPLQWLEAIEGTATANVDLAALDQSLPGLLPLRDGAELLSGRIYARLDSAPQSKNRTSELNLRSDELRGRSQGRAVLIDPIELTATVSSTSGVLTAEQFRWTSTFGTAMGQGNARAGNVDFDIDFGRLSSMLRPLAEISEANLAGVAKGTLAWNSTADGTWRLSGDGNASNLLIALPDGQAFKRPSLKGRITAVGQWDNQTLEQLSEVIVDLNSDGLDISAELAEPITQPSATLAMPFRIRGAGRLETLHATLGPWLPPELHQASGGFTMNATANLSAATARLTSTAVELTNPHLSYGRRQFTQPNIKIHFEGEYVWPSGSLDSRSFTIAGDAFSAAAKGSMTVAKTEMDIKWRAKLERLQGSVSEKISVRNPPTVQQVSYASESMTKTGKDWLLMGDCEGSVTVTSRDQWFDIVVQTDGTSLAIVQPPQASAQYQTVGPPRPGALGRPELATSQIVWSEPNLTLDGRLRYDTLNSDLLADAIQVAGDWFATTQTGKIAWNAATGVVELDGPARLKMNEVAQRLSSLAGIEIQATGIQQTPLSIRVARRPDGLIGLTITANLGWESGEVAGIRFGSASIPVRLDESSVSVSPATIPVDQGSLRVAGQVHYRPGSLWMRVEPGVLAESIRLSPEQTNRWLKYVAPLVANSTRIDGMIGVEIDEALIVFDQPEQSRVAGRLNVGGVQMMAGPLAQQIITGVNQLKSISNPLATQDNPPVNQTLIKMPPQTVGFTVERGYVSHDRLFMEVDRAQVVTSGRVSLAGQLALVAQVPLDPRWLGRDLQGLAGQPVTLQIDGTLSRPSLDSNSVRNVITQLGAQAVQSSAENYLQQQINRGLDSIFGR
jgi:hypothetical protein